MFVVDQHEDNYRSTSAVGSNGLGCAGIECHGSLCRVLELSDDGHVLSAASQTEQRQLEHHSELISHQPFGVWAEQWDLGLFGSSLQQ